MKKIAALTLGLLLSFSFMAVAGPSDADQKWLGAVKTMVAEGKTKITTPSEERANLLKDWGSKSGYSVKVAKTDAGFTLELVKKNEVAVNK